MEDLISKLACNFELSGPNNIAAPHPRFSSYKNLGERSPDSNQDKRRKKLLEDQKKRRFDYINHVRRLVENDWEDDKEEENKESCNMECDLPRKPSKSFKCQLMLSEWLVEIPEDLATEWLLVLCPVGWRNLIIAAKGITSAYNKTGKCVNTFPSLLPGGNKRHPNDYTLLDTIFCEKDKTYYVLDMMCWKKQPIFDSDTEFRFYWFRNKLEEIPDLKTIGESNPYKFVPLPNHACTPESIVNALIDPKVYSGDLDGLLFYHKHSHYTRGSTPLVGWLKVYMVPEILNVEIPSEFMEKRPKKYTSLAEHVKYGEKKREQKKIIRESRFKASKAEPMMIESKENE